MTGTPRKIFSLFWLAIAVGTFSILVALPTLAKAQGLDVGLDGFAEAAGLASGDPRIIIARIIRVLLGFLGIIAILLIVYAGYLWMTAAGNEDRIHTARLILVNAVIGLVIIVSAFAIVSFLLGKFLAPDRPQSCNAGDPPRDCSVAGCAGVSVCEDVDGDGSYFYSSCDPFPGCVIVDPTAFVVSTYTPPNGSSNIPRNTLVTVKFNAPANPATLTYGTASNSVLLYPSSDPAAIIPATLATDDADDPARRRIIISPTTPCEAPNDAFKCLASDTEYTVELTETVIQSLTGRPLDCSYPSNPCTAIFTTGDYVDTEDPTVVIKKPSGNPAAAPTESLVDFQARGRDDAGIARIEFYDRGIDVSSPADDVALGDLSPAAPPYTPFTGTVPWSTIGFPAGSIRNLEAIAVDWVGRQAEAAKPVILRPPYCFDGVRSGDETGTDCGGGCGACPGESCDADAATQSCEPNVFGCAAFSACDPTGCACAEPPVITAVTPNDGAPGNFITVSGRGFGETPGTVTFLGTDADDDGDAADDPAGVTDDTIATAPLACSSVDTWRSTELIIEVPASAVIGPLEVKTTLNLSDRTNEEPDPVLPNFEVNAIVRPGLCAVTPNAACFSDPAVPSVTFTGRGFGPTSTPGRALFGGAAGELVNWLPNEVKSKVANVTPSTVNATIERSDGVRSNPVSFTVNSCAPRPFITLIDPNRGPADQAITITGENFGAGVGKVLFVAPDGTETEGVTNLGEQCSASSTWRHNQIILKVPTALTVLADYDVYVLRQDGVESNRDKQFTLTNDPLSPALFCVKPNNGPENIASEFFGERFGASQGNGLISFTDNTAAPVGTPWPIDSWADKQARGRVPVGAATGPVRVIDTTGAKSNPVNFTVGSCIGVANACGSGSQCCGDGSCSPIGEECPVKPPLLLASYRWRFATGNPAPRVVESQMCTINALVNGDFEGGTDNGAIVGWGEPGDSYDDDFLQDVAGSHFYRQLDCSSAPCPYGGRSELVQYLIMPQSIGGAVFTLSLAARHSTANEPLRAWIVDANDITNRLAKFDFPGGGVRLTTAWERYTGSVFVPSSVTDDDFYLVIELTSGAEIDNVLLETTLHTTQSPSPWKGSIEACTNAQLSLRFTTQLKPGLGVNAIELQSCGADASCKSPGPKTNPSVPPTLFTYIDSSGNERGGFTANIGGLQPNTWYQATATQAVLSDENVPMRAPYSWRFKTRSGPCAVAGVSCQPSAYTLRARGATLNLAAGLTAVNCNLLNCGTGDVTWASSASGVASINPAFTACSNIATAGDESPPVADISTTSTREPTALAGQCRLTVRYADLMVREHYPACSAACINASIGALFNVPINPSTVTATSVVGAVVTQGTVTLRTCDDALCTTPGNIVNIALVIPGDNLSFSFSPADPPLAKSTFYQVTLAGGANGLKSVDGKQLANTNATESGTPVYRWVFKTKDSACDLARLETTPADVTVRTIGAETPFFTQPWSSADECDVRGQRLVPTDYGYGWSTGDVTIATVSNRDSISDDDPDTVPIEPGRIDPSQDATAIGTAAACGVSPFQCSTPVTAEETVSEIEGSGRLTLQCGFEQPGRCAARAANLIRNASFEAAAEQGNVPAWGDPDARYPASFVIAGDAASGGKYYRQKDCAIEICPFAEGLAVELIAQPIGNTTFTLRFSARHSQANREARAYLAVYDPIQEEIQRRATIGFDGSNRVRLDTDWRSIVGTTTVPPAVTDDVFYLIFELPAGAEVDDVSLIQHSCPNQGGRACSSDAQCAADPLGQPLNLCGGGTPAGTCNVGTLRCSNDATISCDDGAGQPNNKLCNFAVNVNGCCGIRPWVESITGSIRPGSSPEALCRNAAFTVTFSALMDRASIEGNTRLEWLDEVGDITNCNLEESLAVAEPSFFKRVWAFVRQLFVSEADAVTPPGTWCPVTGTRVTTYLVTGADGQPQKTQAVLTVSSLLESFPLKYRVVVKGDTASDPAGGAKSFYGVPLDGNVNDDSPGDGEVEQGFPRPPVNGLHNRPGVGTELCVVDHVDVDINPALSREIELARPRTPERPYDLFSCFGDKCNCNQNDGRQSCRVTLAGTVVPEDQDPATPGNQHYYVATARDSTGQALSSNYAWNEDDPQEFIELGDQIQSEEYVKFAARKSGFALVTVTADLGNLPETRGENRVPITAQLCRNPWDTPLQDGPDDTKNNFYTTYCRDTSQKDENGDEILLPDFNQTEITVPAMNPLGIRAEWILKDPTSGSPDAIGVRVVNNKRHLTPERWYAEQPFEKGTPQSLTIDGYPAIRDGRTIYIAGGNAVGSGTLYTNIYIFSHNQDAKPSTVTIFNQLLRNVLLNINHLASGSCINRQTAVPDAGRRCLVDADCAATSVCDNDKSAISRDTKRLADTLEIGVSLTNYQYGSSCPTVAPGAAGDANCNGVVDGYDVTLGEWYRLNPGEVPSYCRGADYDGDGDVDATDVNSTLAAVQQGCSRPANRSTNFPPLQAGTYVPSTSTSRWPSWVATLGNTLSTQLPIDPFNYFAACEVASLSFPSHDQNTCWDEVSKTYASHNGTLTGDLKIARVEPPPDVPWANVGARKSQVYTYSAFGRCSTSTTEACLTDAHCPAGETCIGEGQDYAACSFFERGYSPTPAVLNQFVAGSRMCLVTSEAARDRLPPPPTGTLIGDGTIIPPDPDLGILRIRLDGSGAGELDIYADLQDGLGNAVRDTCVKPAGITATCEFAYPRSISGLGLVATELNGAERGGWGGACSGQPLEGACGLSMAAYQLATFTFTNEVTIVVLPTSSSTGDASITITSPTESKTCSSVNANCSLTFTINPGDHVTVVATPRSGTEFVDWDNSCSFRQGVEAGATCSNLPLVSQTLSVELRANQPTADLTVPAAGSLVDGQPFTVNWATTNAALVSLRSEDGSINISGLGDSGSQDFTAVSAMNGKKLTLTADNGFGDIVTDEVVLTVYSQIAITSLTASPDPIAAGSSTTLEWQTSGPTPVSVVVTRPDGTTTTLAGTATTYTHSPAGTGTKTYTVTVQGPGGSTASRQVSVDVFTPPSVTSFTVDRAEIATGEQVVFSWVTENATGLSISGNPNIPTAGKNVNADSANPTALTTNTTETRTYTLTATGPVGPAATRTVTVKIHQHPGVSLDEEDGLTAVDPGQTASLAWTVNPSTGGDFNGIEEFTANGVNLSGYDANAPDGTLAVSPSVTTTYIITTRGYGSLRATDQLTIAVRPTVNLSFDTGGSAPDGTVSVLMNSTRPGKTCTSDCLYYPNVNDAVTLTASVPVEWALIGWSGCNEDPGNPNLCAMNAGASGQISDVEVILRRVYPLTIAKATNGGSDLTVNGKIQISAPAPWPSTTLEEGTQQIELRYPEGTVITLTAENVPDSAIFENWLPVCSGTQLSCQITMPNGFTSAVAVFETRPEPPENLVVVGPSGGNCHQRSAPPFAGCTVAQYRAACLDSNYPCAPGTQLRFDWSGGAGADSFVVSPWGYSTAGSDSFWPTPSGTRAIPGSTAVSVSAVNGVGSAQGADNLNLWMTWLTGGGTASELIADGTVGNGNISGEGQRHEGASPWVVVPSVNAAYVFYAGEGSGGSCSYRRSTTAGNNFSWTTARSVVATSCRHVGVWYDQWTPGVGTQRAHVGSLRADLNKVQYSTVDTVANTFQSHGTTPGTLAIAGNTQSVSVARTTTNRTHVTATGSLGGYVDNCPVQSNACTTLTPDPYTNTTNEDEAMQLVALTPSDTAGPTLLYHLNIAARRLYAEYYAGGSWFELPVDTVLDADSAVMGGFSALTSPIGNTSPAPGEYSPYGTNIIAYRHDGGSVSDGVGDEIRVKWRPKDGTFQTSALGISGEGALVDVALALDTRYGYLYLAYSIRSNAGLPETAQVYYRRSVKSIYDSTWASSGWTSRMLVIPETGNYNALSMNYLSSDRLYLGAVSSVSGSVRLRGVTMNVLTPP